MLFKTRRREHALAVAAYNGGAVGFCRLDGFWYVGPEPTLMAITCIDFDMAA